MWNTKTHWHLVAALWLKVRRPFAKSTAAALRSGCFMKLAIFQQSQIPPYGILLLSLLKSVFECISYVFTPKSILFLSDCYLSLHIQHTWKIKDIFLFKKIWHTCLRSLYLHDIVGKNKYCIVGGTYKSAVNSLFEILDFWCHRWRPHFARFFLHFLILPYINTFSNYQVSLCVKRCTLVSTGLRAYQVLGFTCDNRGPPPQMPQQSQ